MRIFVSHGIDKSDKSQVDFLRALRLALDQPTPAGHRHEALVDERILEAGDGWTDVLFDCLDECDHAVLLLTPRALSRPWVWQEATILSFRQRRHGSFTLYPVLHDGVTPEAVQQHPVLGALDLQRLQAFAPGAGAAAVAAKIHADLDLLPQAAEQQLDRVAEALAAQLAHLHPDNAAKVAALCARLAAPLSFASQGEGRRLGLGLARAIVGRRLAPIKGLSGLIRHLRNECALDDDHAERVRELAAPLWVDSVVAESLAGFCQAAVAVPPYAAALYAAYADYSARMVVHRLLVPDLPLDGRDAVLRVSEPEDGQGAEGLIASLCRQYAQTRPGLTKDQADARLRNLREPLYALLPPPVPAVDVLTALRKRFPKLVLLAGTGTPAPAPHELPDGVVPLPALDARLEEDNLFDYDGAGGNA